MVTFAFLQQNLEKVAGTYKIYSAVKYYSYLLFMKHYVYINCFCYQETFNLLCCFLVVTMYFTHCRVSDEGGALKITEIASKPLKKELLDTNVNIYPWIILCTIQHN